MVTATITLSNRDKDRVYVQQIFLNAPPPQDDEDDDVKEVKAPEIPTFEETAAEDESSQL